MIKILFISKKDLLDKEKEDLDIYGEYELIRRGEDIKNAIELKNDMMKCDVVVIGDMSDFDEGFYDDIIDAIRIVYPVHEMTLLKILYRKPITHDEYKFLSDFYKQQPYDFYAEKESCGLREFTISYPLLQF